MTKFILAGILVLLSSVPVCATLSGAKLIGPTGDYANIGAALTDIQAQGLDGPLVLELQPGYTGTVETYPLVFTNLGTTSTNTLTLRPQLGATGLSLSSADTTAATVDLNGAQFVTIDGRPGGVGSNPQSGVGTASQLSIANIANTGITLRFINEASNNTVEYVTLAGVNNKIAGAVVLFSNTTTANGNNNNTIDHCDIRDGTTTPLHGIYSVGTTTTTAQFNSGETISNCNIYNFYSSSSGAEGVELRDGSNGWTISGNSFYQTATRPAQASAVYGILINSSIGGFVINGNFIGGDSPGAGVTTQPWTTTGTSFSSSFHGIYINPGGSVPNSIQGNTVRNIVWTTAATGTNPGGIWCGIEANGGPVNIGGITGNTIGSSSGTGSVFVTTAGSGGTVFGIGTASDQTVVISNNTIGSITNNGTSNSVSASIIGIQVNSGTTTISNNLIGSLTDANSLNAATSSTATTGQRVTGIYNLNAFSAAIAGNTIANLNNNYAGTATTGQTRGIVTLTGVNTITGNTVRNLSTTSQNADATTSQSVFGISQTSTAQGQTVSQNVIDSLANTAASAAVNVTGIYYVGPAGGLTPNVIARNFVHHLTVSSTAASAAVNGIVFGAGVFNAQNNMVQMGIDAGGAGSTGAATVVGINDNGTTSGRNFYNNSVYVGGTETSGSTNTFAFTSIGVSNTRAFRDNIFVNVRSNSGSSGKHYAVNYGGVTANPPGLTSNTNLFFANGSGGVLGLFNGADIGNLASWKAATGQDAGSLNADPHFVNPAGTSLTADLHLQGTSPAGNAAAAIAAVTDDFDGEARNATTPDIGADEMSGNDFLSALTLSSGALSPLFSSGTLGYNATVSNSVASLTATLTGTSAYAGITLNGAPVTSGVASAAVDLNVGVNTLTIVVTSQDLSTFQTYTVTVTRQGASVFQQWASANGVSSDPNAFGSDGTANLENFAFGMNPNSSAIGTLVFNGDFTSGGTIAVTGQPMTRMEGADTRALFVRRKDFAAAGVTYTVAFTSDLAHWQTSTDTPVVLADDGTYQIVSVPYPGSMMTGGFFKIELTMP